MNVNFILLPRFLKRHCHWVLIHILYFKDQWNVTDSQTNSASDNRSKGELRNSQPSRDQETVKKTSLFEEDDEDDLFAIAKDR